MIATVEMNADSNSGNSNAFMHAASLHEHVRVCALVRAQAIVLLFNGQTNSAGMGSAQGDCGAALDATSLALLDGAACTWTSVQRILKYNKYASTGPRIGPVDAQYSTARAAVYRCSSVDA